MRLTTCLLLSDDPDDHIEFTEALHEVCESSVVMIVMNADKATRLLAMKKVVPDVVIVDVAIAGFDSKKFFQIMEEDAELGIVPLLAYGELADVSIVDHARISTFLASDVSYSGLRKVLTELLNSR